MSRMVDRIIADGFGELKKAMNIELSRLPVVVIDNVAEYYFGQWAAGAYAGEDGWKTLANVAPPFERYWVEFTGIGKFMAAPKTEREKASAPLESVGLAIFTEEGGREDPWRWRCVAVMFGSYGSSPPMYLAGVYWHVMANGGLMFNEDRKGYLQMVLNKELGVCSHETDNVMDQLALCGVFPTLLGISFMHCKNVVRTLNEPKLDRASRRRIAMRKEKPPVKYYTLGIDPMKEVLKREGQSEKTGLQKALHICRGHFAHYGDEYGRGKLFGKYEGRFWMPAVVKGASSEGVVIKDYSVKPKVDA